jgi:hypothetical protein
MKALLRSFLVVLMLLGGYAGFTTNANATSTHLPGGVPFPPSANATSTHLPGGIPFPPSK